MARPLYEPSEADRATVQNMVALGAPHKTIALCIGNNGIAEGTLRKHFKRELKTAEWNLKTVAMSRLVAAVNRGDPWALRFYLERKAGFAESHRLVDAEGNDRGLSLSDIDDAIAAREAEEQAHPEAA
jgi:hypothetical protein